jgi:type VI secretion system secreted protein Hcp
MKFHRITALLAVASICSALAAPASGDVYLRVTADKGSFKGSAVQKGREGAVVVLAFEHTVTAPRDPASGQATGRRQHKPLVFTKGMDASSVAFHQALTNNEKLKEVVLEFWQASPKGTEVKAYTITLKNAFVSSVRQLMPNKESASVQPYEEVSLTYESITWTFTDGGASTSDTWAVQSK